jgi:protein TonB
MARRIPAALVLACFVTFGLFWTMQALVSVTGELKEGTASPKIEFVRLRKNNTPPVKKREPPKRQKPEQAPPPPAINVSKASLEPSGDVGAFDADFDVADALAGGIGAGGGSDRDATPLVRIEPEYPLRLRQRGIEGWVAIHFTIAKTGTVKDAVVNSSQPPGVFDKTALAAVRRWRYNPKIVDGKPVERPGQRVLFPFSMEDAR